MAVKGTFAVRLAVLGLAAGLAGCSSGSIWHGEYGEAQKKNIDVDAGKTFAIRLPSDRATGYEWRLAQPLNGDHLKLVDSHYNKLNSKLVGAGGDELWTFQAVKRGEATIVFEYARPSEADTPPARTATYTIEVD